MRLLLRLELRRAVNGLRRLARSPLRLVAALLVWTLAIGGLAIQFVMSLVTLPTGHTTPLIHITGATPERLSASLFGLLLYLTWHILDGAFRDGLLVFSASDVDFVFPSPIPRRKVLAYKLARDYLMVAGIVLLVMLFVGPHVRLLEGDVRRMWLLAAPGLWLYLMLLLNGGHLLNLWRTFHAHRLPQAPVLLRAGFVALAIGLVALGFAGRDGTGFAGWSVGLVEALRSTAGRLLLLPPVTAWEALLAPLDGVPPGLAVRLAVVAALAFGSGLILATRPENIYEPSVGVSGFGTRLRQAMRSGDRAAVRALLLERRTRRATRSRLAPLGHGAGVLLWRSFVCTFTSPLRTLLLYALLAVGMPLLLVVSVTHGRAEHLLPLSPLFCLYIAYVGGMSAFRLEQAELRRADLLKPLPLPGWQVLLAQLMPTTVCWAGFLLLGLGVLRLAAPAADYRAVLAVAASLPPMLLLLGLLNVAVALVFPSEHDQAQGVASALATLLLTALVLGPGLVLGAVLAFVGWSGTAIGAACGGYLGLAALIVLAVAHHLYRRFEPVDL